MIRYLCLFAFFAPALGATAQTPPDSGILTGVKQINAIVEFTWDVRFAASGMLGENQARAVATMRFELELRKLGLVVSPTAGNRLICDFTTMATFAGGRPTGYVLNVQVAFQEPVILARIAQQRWVTVWDIGGLHSGPPDDFRAAIELQAQWCAEAFGNKWLGDKQKS